MSSENAQDMEKHRILIVDDSKVMRMAAVKLLKKDFDVQVAEDGVEGWEKITADPSIKVVFSDLSMPHLDGYGLLAKVRNSDDERIQNLPLIIITGAEDDDAAREKALENGATDFITKPFNSVDIKARATAHATSAETTQELKQQAEELQENASIDPMTKLGNKNCFHQRLKQDLSFAIRHRQEISLVRIDIDLFNRVFLQHGKRVADALLKALAKIIDGKIRREDTAARIGLARFALILPQSNPVGARHLAERLRKQIAETRFRIGDVVVNITLSVGVMTVVPDTSTSSDDLLTKLDMLVNRAVKQGGNLLVSDQDGDGQAAPAAAVSAAASAAASSSSAAAEAPSVRSIRSIDEALQLINSGNVDAVKPSLDRLIERLQPLLKCLEPEQRERIKQGLE